MARGLARSRAQAQALILAGRVSRDPEDWERRVRLAELLDARVLTDLKVASAFPTDHPLHGPDPAIAFTPEEGVQIMRDADVILSLDWVDLGGSLRQACGGKWPNAKVISCSMDEYCHNGWSMDYQTLPSADIAVLAPADRLVDLWWD